MGNQDMLTAEISISGEIPTVLVTSLCQAIADNGMKAVWVGLQSNRKEAMIY